MGEALRVAQGMRAARDLRPEEITEAEISRRWWAAWAVLIEAMGTSAVPQPVASTAVDSAVA